MILNEEKEKKLKINEIKDVIKFIVTPCEICIFVLKKKYLTYKMK